MSLKNLPINLELLRPWLTFLVIVWLLASFGLGWLVNSLLIVISLMLILPVIAIIWFRWWVKSKLVANPCPVCGYQLTGLDNTQLQCISCGEQLVIRNGIFQRFAPEGTIDITAVEVPTTPVED